MINRLRLLAQGFFPSKVKLQTLLLEIKRNRLQDLFFRYEYNNFLHTQVVQCIQTVLSNAVTITTSRALVYSADTEQSSDVQKEDEDLENPRKVAPLLTHVSTFFSFFPYLSIVCTVLI